MKCVLWIVGAPGVGKTALVRLLLEGGSKLNPKPKWTVGTRICAAGHYNGSTFDGADSVPISEIKPVLNYWKDHLQDRELTIFDGDKFSNANAKAFLADALPYVRCVRLTAEPGVLAERRRARGSNQNEVWMRGRATKAANFSMLFSANERLVLDTNDSSPLELARSVRAWLLSTGAAHDESKRDTLPPAGPADLGV